MNTSVNLWESLFSENQLKFFFLSEPINTSPNAGKILPIYSPVFSFWQLCRTTEAQCFALSATKSKTFFIIKKDVELGISRAIRTSSALQSFINLNTVSQSSFFTVRSKKSRRPSARLSALEGHSKHFCEGINSEGCNYGPGDAREKKPQPLWTSCCAPGSHIRTLTRRIIKPISKRMGMRPNARCQRAIPSLWIDQKTPRTNWWVLHRNRRFPAARIKPSPQATQLPAVKNCMLCKHVEKELPKTDAWIDSALVRLEKTQALEGRTRPWLGFHRRFVQNLSDACTETMIKTQPSFRWVMLCNKKMCFLFLCLVIPRSVAEDVLIFGRFNSTATTALAVVTANRRRPKRVVRGIGCVSSLGGDETRFHTRTDPKLQNDSTFDKLCDAAGPIVVPATSSPVSCDLQRRKKCFYWNETCIFWNWPKHHLMRTQELFCNVYVFFAELMCILFLQFQH